MPLRARIAACLLAWLLPGVAPRAAEVITNLMSPVVSYQIIESFGEPGSTISSPIASYQFQDRVDETTASLLSPLVSYQFLERVGAPGTPIMSEVASYQYFDRLPAGILAEQSSPAVSYFYQFSAAGGPVVLRGRVTTSGGLPLPGAALTASVAQQPVAEAAADAAGHYALPPLGSGVYLLTARAPGHAPSSRALTLNPSTAPQDFQLAPLPAPPATLATTRQPPASYTAPRSGPLQSTLKIFDGAQFVPISAQNQPSPSLMTIVMTHGWNSNPDVWATNMAKQMQKQGLNSARANIIAWDWREAAGGFIPEERTPSQGLALGRALQDVLEPRYAEEVHFIGHSLGTLVNAAAANYLHGDRTALQEMAISPWLPERTHVTLLDDAQAAAWLELAGSAAIHFNGIWVSMGSTTSFLAGYDNVQHGWKPALPKCLGWADNYISLVGSYQLRAVNVQLEKSLLILHPNPFELFKRKHGYSYEWYALSVANPKNSILGFQRSFEAQFSDWSVFDFPPAAEDFVENAMYYQPLEADDPLTLTPDSLAERTYGFVEQSVVRGVNGAVRVAGEVKVEVLDAAQAAKQKLNAGFEHVSSLAAQGREGVVGAWDQAVLQFRLRTRPASAGGGLRAFGADPAGQSNTPAMAWLSIAIPADASALAFDFIIEGHPAEDLMVFGLGESNLFSLEAKFIPTNAISASPLIPISEWAGSTNELFFGLLGGTSTNATLQVENIRFYSLAPPRLEIALAGAATLLQWPISAGGYTLESTPALAPAAWEKSTFAPVIQNSRYTLTNRWPGQTRFFRLTAR